MSAISLSTLQTAPTGTWPLSPGLSGYYCSCGAWVQYGTNHQCWNWTPNVQTWIWPSTGSYTVPSISTFKGAVKALKDLPRKAATGDAYYVSSEDALVVRQSGGWFHYDKA